MYRKIICNDFIKNKLSTLTMIMFIAAAAMLVSLASIMAIHLFGSLHTLMDKAKTPHFMQMHAGEVDSKRLEGFANNNRNVDQFQLVEFLNIEGSQFIFGGEALDNSVQDNGLSVQNEKFDFLLDLEGQVIEASDGEIYVPVMYLKDRIAKLGDRVIVSGQPFIVAGFIRDSIMNASLSTSKRFIVSQNDYANIKKYGSVEYLIEFTLHDLSKIGEFETAYANAGLEMNGPTITFVLFQLMNVISDGLLIGVIFLVSILVIAIAFMCIRFTLLAKVEDDYREIGVMKAIGLRVFDIKKMYIAKYAAIAGLGSLLGFLLSLAFKNKLIENIRLYMGESEQSTLAYGVALMGILLVIVAVLLYVNNVLSIFKKIATAEAIRFGMQQGKLTASRQLKLSTNSIMNTNVFLGLKDVVARKKLYVTKLVVIILSSFIMLVPQNLYSTISSNSFKSYMGIGQYDLRIQIPGTAENLTSKVSAIITALNNDHTISNVTVLPTKTFKAQLEEGVEENIKIELGDHTLFPIQYISGHAPRLNNEIALSSLYADEWSLDVGDSINVVIEEEAKALTVSGVYSDITNGGKTAKAIFNDQSASTMWTVICITLFDQSLAKAKAKEYAEKFSYAKISDIDVYVKQTFGSTISAVKVATFAASTVAIVMTMLVTLLFMNMLVTKDRYSIAILKAIGFTSKDIKIQYVTRALFILVVGVTLGTILANSLGELLVGLVISSLGASTFAFKINPLSAYLLTPLMLFIVVLIAAVLGIWRVEKIKISEHIKE